MNNFIKLILGGNNSSICHAYGITDTGRRRENNEDFYLIRPEQRIFIVADGMGGHNAGEVASSEAVKVIDEFFTAEIVARMDSDSSSICPLMSEAFNYANSHVNRMAQQNPEYKGMGCTLIMAFVSGDTLHTCHVGDVRCYIISSSGIRQLTNDHSEVAKLVREGAITDEEARISSRRNYLTQAIGHMSILESEYNTHRLENDDRVLLCSDGLWDMLFDSRIQEIFSENSDIEHVCKHLIGEANNAGGCDNVTVVAIEADHE